MISISDRLNMVASLLGSNDVIADVGCDHGYLPIYLLEKGAYKCAIAMDVNKGPLDKARENIKLHNLSDRIDTRLSDGVSALKIREADSISVCGMGGNVMMHIFHMGNEILQRTPVIVLQPQSEYALLRRYLLENGYVFDDEDIVFEDGKYYFAWKLHFDEDVSYKSDISMGVEDVKFCYSLILCKKRSSVYREYLIAYRHSLAHSMQSIQSHSPGNIRLEELAHECSVVDNIIDKYYN